MTKIYVLMIVYCLFFAPGAFTPVKAATIEFTNSTSLEPIYSLDIITDTEPFSLYDLIVGDVLDLSGLGDLFAGDYLVSSVNHSFNGDGYTTHFTLERPLGLIMDSNGNTDINLTLVNYEFATFEIALGNKALTGFTFVANVPEPSTLILFAVGLFGLIVYKRKRLADLSRDRKTG